MAALHWLTVAQNLALGLLLCAVFALCALWVAAALAEKRRSGAGKAVVQPVTEAAGSETGRTLH